MGRIPSARVSVGWGQMTQALAVSVERFVESPPPLTWKLCLAGSSGCPVKCPHAALHVEFVQQETAELLKFLKRLKKLKLHKKVMVMG